MLGQILRPWAAVATSPHLGKLSSSRSPPARCLPNSKTQQEGRHSGTAAQHPAGVRPHGSPPTTGHRPPRVTAQVTGQRAAWAADGEVEATTAPGWGTSQSTSPHYSQCPTLRTDPAPTRHGHRQPRVGLKHVDTWPLPSLPPAQTVLQRLDQALLQGTGTHPMPTSASPLKPDPTPIGKPNVLEPGRLLSADGCPPTPGRGQASEAGVISRPRPCLVRTA